MHAHVHRQKGSMHDRREKKKTMSMHSIYYQQIKVKGQRSNVNFHTSPDFASGPRSLGLDGHVAGATKPRRTGHGGDIANVAVGGFHRQAVHSPLYRTQGASHSK